MLDGVSPWVTGWGYIDTLHIAARQEDDTVVWALLDVSAREAGPAVEARDGSSLTAEPLSMVAVMASSTVQLSFAGHHVPPERVTATLPFAQWPSRDAAGLRANGSLALGLAARCCELIGPGPLDEQVAQGRTALDSACLHAMPGARAAACELALRATAVLVVSQGSSAILAGQDAQRLAREALFLLVFGSWPPIRQALGALLTRPVGQVGTVRG